MENKYQLTERELNDFVRDKRTWDIEKCMEDLIALIKFKQEEFETAKGHVSGYDVLRQFFKEGLISDEVHTKLRLILDAPHLGYTINIKDV